jgi:hypothetical protein
MCIILVSVTILLIDISVILTGKIYSNLFNILFAYHLEYIFIFIPFCKFSIYFLQIKYICLILIKKKVIIGILRYLFL